MTIPRLVPSAWPASAAAVAIALAAAGSAARAHSQSPPAAAKACVAIVLPSTQGVQGDASTMSASLRDLFAEYLTGPSLEPLLLESRLASQAALEAQQKGCANLLTVKLTHKRSGGSGLGRALGQAAGTAAIYMPGGRTAGSAVARGAVIGGAHAVSSMAATTRKKDEAELEYRLTSPDGVVRLGPKTEKAKAKEDGEDLLTPLVERAAGAIAAAVLDAR